MTRVTLIYCIIPTISTVQKFYIHFLTIGAPEITQFIIDIQLQQMPAKKYYLHIQSFTAKPQNLFKGLTARHVIR